jgi:protein-tyrosine phosphatase
MGGLTGVADAACAADAGRLTLTSNVIKPWRRGLLWLALLAPFFYASYGLANHLAAARAQVPAIVFGWEKQVPFWDWTIFPYWSINVFYGLSLLLARTRHELDRHAARLLTAQVLAVLCFIAWPLQFSFGQPAVDGAAGWLFAALRGFDKPFNQAPSLHIALALILWDLYRRLLTGRAARFVLHAWTFAICASVLTTWQHHFIDIPTGALLGAVCVWAWPLERRVSMRQACAFTADPRRQALAARYAGGALALAGLALTLGGMGLWLLWGSVSLALVAANYLLFGARGFRMDATGRMAWEARLLLAPYRLGAAINARLWTRGQPPLREVVDGVSLGGLARLPRHARAASSTVVSLSAELDVPAPARGHCLPWLDLVPATPAALRRAAGAIERAVAAGQPVVVSCALGLTRSTAALACWLARSGRAPDAEAAVLWLRRVQPRLVLGDDWQRALREAVGR